MAYNPMCNQFESSLLLQTCYVDSYPYNVTAYIDSDSCYDLLTEDEYAVGQICLEFDYDNYEIHAAFEASDYVWTITEMQLWIGGEKDRYPQSYTGSPDVESFPFRKSGYQIKNNPSFTIPLDDADENGCLSDLCQYCDVDTANYTQLYMLVHAVAISGSKSEDIWAQGEYIRSSGDFSWATRSEIDVAIDCSEMDIIQDGIDKISLIIRSNPGKTDARIGITAVYMGYEYRCELSPSRNFRTFDCTDFDVEEIEYYDYVFDNSTVVIGVDNSESNDEVIIDTVLVTTYSGVVYAVDMFCVEDQFESKLGDYYSNFRMSGDGDCPYGSSRYSSLCVDSDDGSCAPGQQFLHFEQTGETSVISNATWKPWKTDIANDGIEYLEVFIGSGAGNTGGSVLFRIHYEKRIYDCLLHPSRSSFKYTCEHFEISESSDEYQYGDNIVIEVDNSDSSDAVIIDFFALETYSGRVYTIDALCIDDRHEIGKYYQQLKQYDGQCPQGSTLYSSMCVSNDNSWRKNSCFPGRQFLHLDQSESGYMVYNATWSNSSDWYFGKDSVQSLQITVGNKGRSNAEIVLKVWYAHKLYECSLYPDTAGTFVCDYFNVTDCALDTSYWSKEDDQAFLSVENTESRDEVEIDSILLEIGGKMVEIEGFCVNDRDKLGNRYERHWEEDDTSCPAGSEYYSAVCVDNEPFENRHSCYPARQTLMFDVSQDYDYDYGYGYEPQNAIWSAGSILCE